VGVVLGVVLRTKNALRWGLGLFRASSQCNQGGPNRAKSREVGSVDSDVHTQHRHRGTGSGAVATGCITEAGRAAGRAAGPERAQAAGME
jgi:hypothetical protein